MIVGKRYVTLNAKIQTIDWFNLDYAWARLYTCSIILTAKQICICPVALLKRNWIKSYDNKQTNKQTKPVSNDDQNLREYFSKVSIKPLVQVLDSTYQVCPGHVLVVWEVVCARSPEAVAVADGGGLGGLGVLAVRGALGRPAEELDGLMHAALNVDLWRTEGVGSYWNVLKGPCFTAGWEWD